MKYIIFENNGEIDLRSLSTFGCSVKETSNPIGFFGTGLKYAIAVLLRTGHQIEIQSGARSFSTVVSMDTLRGKEFGFVELSTREPLGFTTELGKTWEVWMAYRELYCNAKDEPEHQIYEAEDLPSALAGKTRFIVSGEPIMDAHRHRESFLLFGTPDFVIGSIEVFNKPSSAFFYKGIKVMQYQNPSLYTYNAKHHVDLTEDRTAKEPHVVIYNISRAVLAHADLAMLERVLLAPSNTMEHSLDFHGWSSTPASKDFLQAVGALQRSSLVKVNASALRVWREQSGGFIDPRRKTPSPIQSTMLERALVFCERSGFMLRDEYPIILVESLGDTSTLALADRVGKQIFLTERLFESGGTKGVASALIEEYIHLRFNLDDCSRQMQNFIFDKMVSYAEQLQGEPL